MPTQEETDIFVIGGGVNGAGIARDAAGRGYSVRLAEMGDLASGTSSAATKLVHGGLRYLEHFEFRLVHESLAEREVLWAMAPHIIRPLRFVLPHHKGLRPALVLRAGLALYDNLGGRRLLPGTKTLDLRTDPAGAPLKPEYRTGFEYSDCWVDDARLVVLNARDAAERGAHIHVRTKVTAARRRAGGWAITTLSDRGVEQEFRARLLVNAAGPWIDRVIAGPLGEPARRHVRLVRGSHLVVKRLFDHERSYIFQNADQRIVFAIPYERDFTLIGTTDADHEGDPSEARITDAETAYLLKAASEYFSKPVTRDAIVWAYSGVRPLFDDGASAAQQATRDYVLRLEGDAAAGAALHVFGGKLTTYRRLAESALERIEPVLGPRGPKWTATSKLPGGGFEPLAFPAELRRLAKDYPGHDAGLIERLLRLYGTEARTILGDARSAEDLGRDFGAGLSRREVDHLVETEWARTAHDIVWRRTKLGLRMSEAQIAALDAYLAS